MFTSRFPCLVNPPWRACIRFAITRNNSSLSTIHELDRLVLTWVKPQTAPKAPAGTKSAKSVGSKEKSAPSTKLSNTDGRGKVTTGATQTKKHGKSGKKEAVKGLRDKPPISIAERNLGTKSKKKSLKKDISVIGPELEVPEEVFNELIETPINTPIFETDSLGRRYELRYIECRPDPMNVRIYHPEFSSSVTGNRILYLPSTIPNSFFPSHDSIISTLSQTTCSTIIYPVPTDTPQRFPQSIQNLLRIYDATTDEAPTAIITSGIAAATATALAMTEPNIKAIGIWGGIFNLTKSSTTSTRWNRPLQHWEHLPYGALPPVPKSTNSLDISWSEFKALRRHYYPNPETWVDPFASPLAFFMRSKIEFSRLNMTEVMGEAIREEMVKKASYSESDWEAKVYIYPRIGLTFRMWNSFPPMTRKEDFPKFRIVVPEREDVEEKNCVTVSQAKSFVDVARKRLAGWLKSRLWKNFGGNSIGQTTGEFEAGSEAELQAELQANKQAQSKAEAIIELDTLTKEDTGADEVNTMAQWVKLALEGSSTGK